MRHADLTTEEFTEDTFNGAAAHDGEGVAAVGSDYPVLGLDAVFKSNRDGFLDFSNEAA